MPKTPRKENALYLRERYAKRRAAGLCGRCAAPAKRSWCRACLDHQAAKLKEYREARLARGVCGTCGSESVRKGFANCPRCLARQRGHSKAMRDRRVEAGQCINCGRPKELHRLGKVRCMACAHLRWASADPWAYRKSP